MKNVLLFLALISIGLISCNKETDTYNLSGKIEGLPNQEMILQFVTFNTIVDIDTTSSDAQGNYEFIGKTKEPGFYRIAANGKYWMLRLENETVVYNADFTDDKLTKVEVLKSEKAIKFQEVISYFIVQGDEMASYSQTFQTKQMAGAPEAELKEVENQYVAAINAMKVDVKDKINATSDPITGIYLMDALKAPEDMEFIKTKLNEYAVLMPNSSYILEKREQVKAMEDQMAQQALAAAQSENVAVGSAAPDIVQKNPQGVDLKLSDLKGQVVLIDFWASWCKPCRAENPNVVKAYNDYKAKGFTVLSVSLDKDRDAWMAAIAQDGLVWPNHVSDLQFWNNAAAKLYGVQSIPAAFLVDENGIIVGRDLRGAALQDKLKEILG